MKLSAQSKEDLNQQIDQKLKQGFLLQGDIQTDEQGRFVQTMVQPSNIDSEFTLSSAIKLAIFVPIYIGIFYLVM